VSCLIIWHVLPGSVLQLYSQVGGRSEDLGRTQRFLEDAFQSGAASCLICIGSVKRNDAVRDIIFTVHVEDFWGEGWG
jgi:hypothetical protein